MISQLARKGHHKASNGGSSTPEAAYQTVQYLLIAQVDQALGASMQGAALRNMTVWQSHHYSMYILLAALCLTAKSRKSRKSGRDPLVALERGIRGGAVVSMEHRKGTSSRYLFSSLNGPNSDVHARPLLWCALPIPTSHAAQRAHCEIPFLVRIIPSYSIQLRPFPLSFSSDSTPRLISQFVPPCPCLRHQFQFQVLDLRPQSAINMVEIRSTRKRKNEEEEEEELQALPSDGSDEESEA